MRRSLHSLLVGLLVLSLSIDAARACGHLRSWHPVFPDVYVVVVVADDEWGCCEPLAPACPAVACGCDETAVVLEGGAISACCGEVAVGVPLDARGSTSVMIASPVLPADPVVSDSVLVTGPGSTHVPAAPGVELVPAPAAPEPIAAVPALEPVEPASASEPAVMSDVVGTPDAALTEPVAAPQREPEPVAPPVPAPAPHNVFEEADAALIAPDDAGSAPAVEPATPPEPAADPAAVPQAVREPLRRWIDATAAYAVVGRLVDVRGDRVEILRVDGRSVTVPLDRLSGFDRGYVAGAAERIAAVRPRGPLPRDTAGR